MEKIRQAVALVLAKRAELGIKVRQPLALLKIKKQELKNEKELLELAKEEINVKKVVFNDKIKEEIELDAKITKPLEEEGMAREVIRFIQDLRKKQGLTPKDRIISVIGADFSPKFLKEIKEKTLSDAIEIKKLPGDSENFAIKEIVIKNKRSFVAIKKIK